MFTRRFFIGGCASFGALAGCKAIKVPGAALGGGARVKFGVVSDVHLDHLGDETEFRKALEYFRDQGADGVMVPGDVSNSGEYSLYKIAADTFYDVFPDGKAPDGRKVEPLFIYGNHCIDGWQWAKDNQQQQGWCKRNAIGYAGNRAWMWKEMFHEDFHPIWMKSVKGYTFIGNHWDYDHKKGTYPDIEGFMKKHAGEIDPALPFFYTQHAHPKDTCFGKWAWGHDDGSSTRALSPFPNAVAFTGHSHYPLTDERSIWQGAFTSINAGSLKYASLDYSLRENMEENVMSGYGGAKSVRPHGLPTLNTHDSRHGMLVSVFDDHVAIERRDFTSGLSLGDDWVFPLPTAESKPFAYAEHSARRVAPEFAPGAKVRVSTDREDAENGRWIDISFSAAKSVDRCRVFEYEVSLVLVEDGVDLVQIQRRMMANDYHLPEAKAGKGGRMSFFMRELPLKGHYVASIRPIECFGKKGEAIESEPFVVV